VFVVVATNEVDNIIVIVIIALWYKYQGSESNLCLQPNKSLQWLVINHRYNEIRYTYSCIGIICCMDVSNAMYNGHQN